MFCSHICVWPDYYWCTLDDLGEALESRSDDYLVVPVPEDWEEDLLNAVAMLVSNMPPVPVRVIHKSTPEALLRLASGDTDGVWAEFPNGSVCQYKRLHAFLSHMPKDPMFRLYTTEPVELVEAV